MLDVHLISPIAGPKFNEIKCFAIDDAICVETNEIKLEKWNNIFP